MCIEVGELLSTIRELKKIARVLKTLVFGNCEAETAWTMSHVRLASNGLRTEC